MAERAWPRWAWFCTRCGAKNAPRVVDCAACRQAFLGPPAPTAAAAVCPSCAERNGSGAVVYCESCGAQLPPTARRKTIMPASTGPVEGLSFGRDVLLDNEGKRPRDRWRR